MGLWMFLKNPAVALDHFIKRPQFFFTAFFQQISHNMSVILKVPDGIFIDSLNTLICYVQPHCTTAGIVFFSVNKTLFLNFFQHLGKSAPCTAPPFANLCGSNPWIIIHEHNNPHFQHSQSLSVTIDFYIIKKSSDDHNEII